MIRIASLYEEWISPVADLFVRNNAFLNYQIKIRSLQLTITQRRTWMFTLKEKWPLSLFKHKFKRSRRFPPTDEGVYTFSTRNEWRTNPLPIFFSVQFSIGNERSLSTKLFTDVQILLVWNSLTDRSNSPSRTGQSNLYTASIMSTYAQREELKLKNTKRARQWTHFELFVSEIRWEVLMICQILDYNTQRKLHRHGQLLNSRASEAIPFQLPRAIVSSTGVAICADDNWKNEEEEEEEEWAKTVKISLLHTQENGE